MKIFLALFLITISTTATAQEKANESYHYAVRLNPLALVDVFDHNFSIGGEYCFHPQWSVTTDLSYIFASSNYDRTSKTSGFIIKPAIRYYLPLEKRFYVEMDVFYKQVGYSITDWVGKNCVNDVPAFEEYKQFIYRKQVGGIDVKGGITTNLSRDQRLRLEAYFGFGIRKRSFGVKDDPRACYNGGRLFDTRNQHSATGVTGSIPMGVRLAYGFR